MNCKRCGQSTLALDQVGTNFVIRVCTMCGQDVALPRAKRKKPKPVVAWLNSAPVHFPRPFVHGARVIVERINRDGTAQIRCNNWVRLVNKTWLVFTQPEPPEVPNA